MGTFFTRDLVSEPANILYPESFAERLAALSEHGVEVTVMGEKELEEIGMGSLLCVGLGSARESKVVVMKWMGGKAGDAPFCAVGKGVTFDTGGISIKPAGGMEEMTMDMGGAGVVSGLMKTVALRKAKANVIGIVGLVENMPDGLATRPGDIVTSLSGKTIEVINTDAEGRLVLADILTYAQREFKPAATVNLATLTGAIIIALGNTNAGFFSNDDGLAGQITDAAKAEAEGIWRMPLAKEYDDLIKSSLADVKNTGGRAAGSITAAQFLQRFVDDSPWAHIDIAGVTLSKESKPLHGKGASGWGVATLNRLVKDNFEG
jgi:leucyl aminopeptidase